MRTWLMPALIFALCLIGLASALLGHGAWDWAAWAALGAPLAIFARTLAAAFAA